MGRVVGLAGSSRTRQRGSGSEATALAGKCAKAFMLENEESQAKKGRLRGVTAVVML